VHPVSFVPPYLQTFSVTFRYPVYFTRGVFAVDNPDLCAALGQAEPEKKKRVLAVLDEGLVRAFPGLDDELGRYARTHATELELVREPLIIPGGESAKNDPALLSGLLHALNAHALDRHSFVLAVGGGAVLDVAGYAAGITHRGVRCVRVPSTVLAQADAGVGVKNGVNAFGKKNFWGTFTPPFAVLNDASLLAGLSARDRIAGTAEAVKVALVRDGEFFSWLEQHAARLASGDLSALEALVGRSAELHLRHIASSGDPFELGSARPLDFGHWAAHKLETMTEYGLRHGEAVAIGMAIDTLYSARTGLCSPELARRVLTLLETLGFALHHPALEQRDADGRLAVLTGLADFREHLGGELTVTLLEGQGRGREVHELDEACIASVIAELASRRHVAHGSVGSFARS
jgi:3-dehydroquinate synthase